jgi:very-short-patch-repair endonuclease
LKLNEAEELLAIHMRERGIDFIREYRFAAEQCGGAGRGLRSRLVEAGLRDWRADFAVKEHRLLIEIEGGGWMKKSRHTSGAGFESDLTKYDDASRLGWIVYRCSPAMVKKGRAIETIQIVIGLLECKKRLNTDCFVGCQNTG